MTCACSCKAKAQQQAISRKTTRKWVGFTLLGLLLWFIIYNQLETFSNFVAGLLPVPTDTPLHESISFFLYDAPKVLLLLVLVVFVMGIIRSYFSPARAKILLTGKHEGFGNIFASCLGIVPPFCSCSAVPLFVGFVSANIPLGISFSFLIAAPLINEVALGLLWGLVGWKIAFAYLFFGLNIAIIAGWIMGKLHLEGWLEPWVKEARAESDAQSNTSLTLVDRLKAGLSSVRDIVGKVWPWMLGGIAAGAFIHGYVPTDLLLKIIDKEAWWSVPASVLVGIPLYSNAAGIIPIAEALLGKGAALGTVLAFMMSVTALSLPEAIILRKILSLRLIAVYFGIVGLGILAVGYLFNFLVS